MAPASSARLAAATLLGLAAFAFWGQERSLAELAAAAAAGWHDGMKAMEAAVKAAGWLAPLYFLVLYTVSSVFCLPLLGFHTVAGYTYGTLRGALLVSICQTVGAGFALLFARHFVRPMVQPRLEKKWGARYKAVDRAVAKQGLKIVFLIRASPILPFSVTNYLVGCTQLGLGPFLLGTWGGVLPGTTTYCSIGAAARQGMEGGQSDAQRIVMVLQLCAAVAVCKVMSDIATRTLEEAGVGAEEAAEDDDVELAKPAGRRKAVAATAQRSRSRGRVGAGAAGARSPSPSPRRKKAH